VNFRISCSISNQVAFLNRYLRYFSRGDDSLDKQLDAVRAAAADALSGGGSTDGGAVVVKPEQVAVVRGLLKWRDEVIFAFFRLLQFCLQIGLLEVLSPQLMEANHLLPPRSTTPRQRLRLWPNGGRKRSRIMRGARFLGHSIS
jgi:hypothetical protein